MCQLSQCGTMSSSTSGTTNFPPIIDRNKLASQTPQHQPTHAEKTRCEPRPPTSGRSNSDFSSGDFWSSARRSISSSNGRSSMSFSSGDASTVTSTDRLWRRRRPSPRRVIRPVTPFPAEEQLHNPSPSDDGARMNIRTTPETDPITIRQPTKARRKKDCFINQTHQPIVEEQLAGETTTKHVRGTVTEDLERTHPSKHNKGNGANNYTERRRRKSMPDIRQKGDVLSTKTGSQKEAGVIPDIMDGVTRDRIMKWLSQLKYVNDEKQQEEDTLSSIDEE